MLGHVAASAQPSTSPLIVVEDRGGVSALPYYQALDLGSAMTQPPTEPRVPQKPARSASDADMLPVHSVLLSPGDVPRRAIQAPGLQPIFVIGNDSLSKVWLQQRLPALRRLKATGLVVNIESASALNELRGLAPGLALSPVSGDDLARRLGLQHYPVLITATAILQ